MGSSEHATEPAFLPCSRKTDVFGAELPELYDLRPGQSAIVEVADCFGCYPACDYGPWHGDANPITGPLRIVGTKPGDMIAVHIQDIGVVGDGFVGTDSERLAVPIDRERGLARFPNGQDIPLKPHLGTIGVAPAAGSASTRIAGDHGGNMDCKRVTAGSTICFRVQIPGTGLGFGDTHAVMGDGETGGQGLEAAAQVSLRVEIVPGLPLDGPYGLCEGRFYLIGWGTTLDAAADMAQNRACALLETMLPPSPMPVRKLLGSIADLRVCWCGGPTAVMRMEIPLDYLPPQTALDLRTAMGVA